MFLGGMTKEMSLEETDDRNKLDKKLMFLSRELGITEGNTFKNHLLLFIANYNGDLLP